MKYAVTIAGLVAVRVLNAILLHTPLDVFIERTILMIVLAYGVTGFRAWRRRRALPLHLQNGRGHGACNRYLVDVK